jgi:hypothetical protein
VESVGIPPLTDHNLWADFWYYTVGVNLIPAHTRQKKTFVEWKRWQIEAIPEDLHAKWKAENAFANGMAIILGRVWRGEHNGEHLIFVDLDNSRAIDEFCTRADKTVPLKEIAEKFIVEQHSEVSFPKKSSDVNVIEDPSKFQSGELPAFEVKGKGTHGIAYCAPSVHKNGSRYQIIGTARPTKLSKSQAEEMKQHIDAICKKYGLQYLENEDRIGRSLRPVADLFRDEYIIVEGNNRHEALLRVMDSLIRRNFEIMSLEEIEQIAYQWNKKHCQPALDDREFDRQWKQATNFIVPQIKEEEERREEEQKPVLELTEELTKEVSWDYIAGILSTSIKKDRAPKLITFAGMLLAQTDEDQLNIGYQAESSTGKSYIPIEVSSYFSKEETELIASASPTAFYHDGGRWDAEKRAIVKDLEHKNLIFLDMPHFQLLEKLRPMLSHDKKELRYMITDKNQKHGLRTKNVIIKGYPSVFFCSTKMDPDEQEKTRMLLLSPSIDQEKLRESLELATLRKSNPKEYKKAILEDPQRLWLTNRIRGIRQWGIKEVVIPDNGKGVRDKFMNEHVHLLPRHQRDYPRIFSFIKAHAVINCFKRDKISSDAIEANQTDIDAGFELYKEIELSNEIGLSPYVFRIYADVVAPLLAGCVEGINGITREDIIKKYFEVRHKMLSPEILRKEILPQLEIVGLIRQEPDPEKKTRMLVYPTVSTPLISAKLAENNGESVKDDTKEGGKDSGVSSYSSYDDDDNDNEEQDTRNYNDEGLSYR